MDRDIGTLLAEQFTRSFSRSRLDDEPGAWISNTTGQVHINYDEIEDRIAHCRADEIGALDCRLCAARLPGEHAEGMLVFDTETRLPVLYPDPRTDLVCHRCIDWVKALHATRRFHETHGKLPEPRFQVGDRVYASGECGKWTVKRILASGSLALKLIWASYELERDDGRTVVKDDMHLGKLDLSVPVVETARRLEVVSGGKPRKLAELVGPGASDPFRALGALEQERRYEALFREPDERRKLR